MWLLVAAVPGLTTVASIASFLKPLRSRTFCTVGVRVLGPEPYVHISNVFPKSVDLSQIPVPLDIVCSSLLQLAMIAGFLSSQ